MAHPSPPELRVLHALRLKWVADENAIALAAGLDRGRVEDELRVLAANGCAEHRTGRVEGWRLTDAGKEAHAKLVHEELEDSGARPHIDDAYGRFLSQNRELLSLCTAWQMREGASGDPVLNDHADAQYDAGVLDRLDAVHDNVMPVARDLADALDRYGPYGTRLSTARDRVRAGDTDWLTRPLIDSYHTVWFELHEDLLVTLGLERKEGET